MHSDVRRKSSTEVEVTVTASAEDLEPIRKRVLNQLRREVTAPGFRPGKAPDEIVERQLGAQRLQAEVLEVAAANFYAKFSQEHQLRALQSPHVEVKKFVPYSQLEMIYGFETLPQIKLADYKKIKKTQAKIEVTEAEINSVIEGLRIRAAKRTEVKRATKSGDEAVVDFVGYRSVPEGKDKVEVPGAKATNYAVLLGSGRLVRGFEDALIGSKAGEDKEFNVTFPKDYPEPTLRGQNVDFKVKIHKINQVNLPAVDDKLAAQVGPFKNLAELKADIKKQVQLEKEQDARHQLTDEVVNTIVEDTKVDLPQGLVGKQQEQLWSDFEANIKAQGQELEKYLAQQKQSREDIEKMLRQEAERRVKTALVLSEIAKAEHINVTAEELEIRLQLLKGQYQDKKMSEQLDRPEAKNQISDQLLMEKTVAKLLEYTKI